MKNVSEKLIKTITKYGKMLDTIITYEINGEEYLLDSDSLFSVNPHFNSNILKSAMKELDIETNVAIPKGTLINVKLGILVDLSLTVAELNSMKVERLNKLPVRMLSSGLKGFEYINLGDYLVAKEPEYNADTLSYSHKCYDKMIYSMKDYEDMHITFPLTIKQYIQKICNHLGLIFANINDTFVNYDKIITNDYYLGYEYTFRDVLDELAQVTASTICINSNNELEIRYINKESITKINEDFLKDTNVTFDKNYGPVNSIVLSRSGESDNVYLQNKKSVTINGLCEIKIVDNQIMNYNDRSDYLPEILEELDGLTYSTNDFDSTGICFLDLCDRYTVNVHGKLYSCVLFNDNIKITQGLEETIYTEMPEVSETDYSKADKTDRKINQAYIIMDKVKKKLEAVVSEQTENSEKITKHEQDINGIYETISNIEDLTRTVKGTKKIMLENCVQGKLLELHIYGNNTVFDYLYPSNDLYPANNLYPYGDSRISIISFQEGSEEGTEKIYELGVTEVLRQNGDTKDEYILKEGKAKVIRRINRDGSIKTKETIEDLGEYEISLLSGENIIQIKNYNASLFAKYAIKSDYTNVFATKIEMNSSITKTAEEINLEVKKKVDENEVISKINQSAEAVGINANKIELSANDVLNLLAGNEINLGSKKITINSENFKVDENGVMSCNNANITGGRFDVKTSSNATDTLRVTSKSDSSCYSYIGATAAQITSSQGRIMMAAKSDTSDKTYLILSGNSDTVISDEGIQTPTLNQTSLEERKKNFEKLENALDIIEEVDIYKYNLKTEKDTDKKHIGFVIGNKYNYSKELTSNNNDGADIYSLASCCLAGIKEQQKQMEQYQSIIEELSKEIQELREGK